MVLLLLCETSFTPGCRLKHDLGVYVEFKIINDYTYPKNVTHIHTEDTSKLGRVKNKSHHAMKLPKLSSESISSFFLNAVERFWKWSGVLTIILTR